VMANGPPVLCLLSVSTKAVGPAQLRAQPIRQGPVVPLALFKPAPQGTYVDFVVDRPNPTGRTDGNALDGAGLEDDYRAVGPRRAGERAKHARGGDQHAVRAASDGGP